MLLVDPGHIFWEKASFQEPAHYTLNIGLITDFSKSLCTSYKLVLWPSLKSVLMAAHKLYTEEGGKKRIAFSSYVQLMVQRPCPLYSLNSKLQSSACLWCILLQLAHTGYSKQDPSCAYTKKCLPWWHLNTFAHHAHEVVGIWTHLLLEQGPSHNSWNFLWQW